MLVSYSPPPGINRDDSTYAASGQWADSSGFRFVNGYAETIGGSVEMSSATAVLRANKMLMYDNGGTTTLAVAGDTLRIGAVDAAGTDITPASGWTSDKRHSLDMFGNVLLALVSGGGLFESSGAQAVAVTNAPAASTVMLVVPSRQVMLLGTNEETSGTFNGRCIRWSDIEDRTDWTTTSSNNAGEYILPGQEDIVSACVLGNDVVIWTEGSMWVARFTGDPAQTFNFERIASVGAVAMDAWAVHDGALYWIGHDYNFYSYQIGSLPQSLPCPIGRYFRDGLSVLTSSVPLSWGCTNSRHGEVWFGVPFGSSLPNAYFVFCVDESAQAQRPVWYSGTTTGLSGSMGAMIESALPWDDGTYRTKMIVHAYATTGSPKPYRWDCGASTKGISTSYIETADFHIDKSQRRMMIRSYIPDFDEQTGTCELTLKVRDRPQSTLGASNTKGPYSITTTTTKKDVRASGKLVRVKLGVDTGNFRLRLGKLLFDAVPMGER